MLLAFQKGNFSLEVIHHPPSPFAASLVFAHSKLRTWKLSRFVHKLQTPSFLRGLFYEITKTKPTPSFFLSFPSDLLFSGTNCSSYLFLDETHIPFPSSPPPALPRFCISPTWLLTSASSFGFSTFHPPANIPSLNFTPPLPTFPSLSSLLLFSSSSSGVFYSPQEERSIVVQLASIQKCS